MTRRHRGCIAARRVRRGSAQSASSRAMVDEGGVWSAYPHCRVYAAAEGNGAGSVGSRRRTQTMTEGNIERSARSRRRKTYLAEGNHARSASSRRRYYAVRSLTDGVGASGLSTEAICAALLDRIATGTRAPSETKRGVPDSAVDGQAGCAVPPSRCQLPVRNVPGWRAFGFPPQLSAAPKHIPGEGVGAEEAGKGGIPPW